MMHRSRLRGFTLVELMIALALGVALSAAVVQVTLASLQSRQLLDAAARLQENGRFALSYLAKDLRTAGYMGCPNLAHLAPTVIATDPPDDLDFRLSAVLQGLDDVAAGNTYGAVAGSDVITLQRMTSTMARLTGSFDTANSSVQVEHNDIGLGTGDFVLIADCTHADLFEATGISVDSSGQMTTLTFASSANDTTRLSKMYGRDAFASGFQSVSYFVRDTGRKTAAGKSIHSLYVKARQFDSSTPLVAQEVVEGVEDIQFTYGEDNNGDAAVDSYKKASDINDWSKVLSVRIELLLHSLEDNVALNAQPLTYNNNAVAQDGRLRKVFSTVVAIRNRLP